MDKSPQGVVHGKSHHPKNNILSSQLYFYSISLKRKISSANCFIKKGLHWQTKKVHVEIFCEMLD